jgi:hypothetical protein
MGELGIWPWEKVALGVRPFFEFGYMALKKNS